MGTAPPQVEGRSTGRYVTRRLLLGAAQVVLVTMLVFVLTEVLPGDAAVVLAGELADPERIQQLRAELELDRPAPERFVAWVGQLAGGNLGTSLVSGLPVTTVIADALPPTLALAAATLLVLVPLSVGLGLLTALREGGVLDRLLTTTMLGLHAIPEFALGMLLVTVFAVQLAWFPPTAVGGGGALGIAPAVLVLPVVVVLARPVCTLSRMVRAGMIDALDTTYVRHARRLGLPEWRVRLAHALPNAVQPAVQQLASTTDWLLSGVVVVEALFVIPGLGSALMRAVSARDIPVVQGLALLFAAVSILVTLAADLTAHRLAPSAGRLR